MGGNLGPGGVGGAGGVGRRVTAPAAAVGEEVITQVGWEGVVTKKAGNATAVGGSQW